MTVYSYTRVSTARQSEEGESLVVQGRVITGYAMMIGLTVDQSFVEQGVSGSVALHDRPQGKLLLSLLKAGDVIIAPKLDRMFRSSLDALNVLANLKKLGVSLHLIDLGGDVTNNGISKLVFTILSAVAEAERDRLRERVTTVKADQRDRGMFLGGKVPFGFSRVGDMLEPVEAEQAAMMRAKAQRASGASLRAIQTAMEAEGYKLALTTISRFV